MKATLKSTLVQVLDKWLEDQDAHDDRPYGLACPNLEDLMADAAASVYDASHAGAVMGAEDPTSCGVLQ
jgi:hypothetical protein